MNDVKETKNMKVGINNPVDEFISKYLDISSLLSQMFSSENSFKIFSFIITGISLITLWIIRTIIFTFYSGVLSVYSIDNGYIDISSYHYFQFIQFLAILIAIVFINYVLVHIWTTPNNKNPEYKKWIVLGIFIITEIILLFTILGFDEGWTIYGVIYTIIHSSLSEIGLLFLVVAFILVIIDYPALMFIFIYGGSKIKNSNLSETKTYSISSIVLKSVVFYLMVSVALIFLSRYLGYSLESQRTDFRVMQQPIVADNNYDLKYHLKYGTYNNCIMYPIIYENENIYIVSRLYKDENNEIKIEKEYQKTLDKNNVETIYIDDIYNKVN